MKETLYFQCFHFLQSEENKALEFLIWPNILSEIELGFFVGVGWLLLLLLLRIFCYLRSLEDTVLPKWCQIFLCLFQLVSSSP